MNRALIQKPCVFQINPPRNTITLLDVRDALDATRYMFYKKDRIDYFASVGMDYDRTNKYWHVVEMLEACYNLPCSKTYTACKKESARSSRFLFDLKNFIQSAVFVFLMNLSR